MCFQILFLSLQSVKASCISLEMCIWWAWAGMNYTPVRKDHWLCLRLSGRIYSFALTAQTETEAQCVIHLHSPHCSDNSYMISQQKTFFKKKGGNLSNHNSFHCESWRWIFLNSPFQRTVISGVKTLNGFCCKNKQLVYGIRWEGWSENGLLWQHNHFWVLNFRVKTIHHSPWQSEVWLISVVNMVYGYQGQISQNNLVKVVI